jgi:enoyl-CoA hydratase
MPVLYEKRGHVALITLSRPAARNCWGVDFSEGLIKYFGVAERDGDIHCVVLTGDEAGRAFSAGADLKDTKTHTLSSMDDFFAELPKWRSFAARVLDHFPKPVIAAVNGYAIGVGCILTYCCDLIIASERAEWRMPQTALGIMPAYGGSVRLARWVGKGQAMKLGMGFSLGSEEAYRIGLAQWLVPHETLMEQAMKVAGHIAEAPTFATQMAKESLNRGLDIPNLEDASWVDAYRFMALSLTEETKQRHEEWRNRKA